MRALPDLQELNGLPVERDLLDDEGEGDEFEELGEIKEAGKETSSAGIMSPPPDKEDDKTKLFIAP